MALERLEIENVLNSGTHTLVLYGRGVQDEFLSVNYRYQPLEEVVFDLLKEQGFQRIVFYSPTETLYFLDTTSRNLCRNSAKAGKTSSSSAERPSHGGPMGRKMLTRKQPSEDKTVSIPSKSTTTPTQDSGKGVVTDERCISLMNSFMRDASIRTAIVFMQGEGVLDHMEVKRELAGYATAWLTLPSSNNNLAIWVFSTSDLNDITERLKRHIPALSESIARRESRERCYYEIPGPSQEEIQRLLSVMRVQGQTSYDFSDISEITQYFVLENESLRRWHTRFRSIHVDKRSARQWLSATISEQTAEERLNSLIGLESVKQQIKTFKSQMEVDRQRRERGIRTQLQSLNMIFSGKPGTGKTTVARLIGEIFRDLRILLRGHVREVDNTSQIISDHVGGTAPLMNRVIDEAMGGILFIDEAYQLAGSDANPFATEALTTLITRMENDRGRFAVIAAGYPDDMERFLKANDGMPRRFPHHIRFDDYNSDELVRICDSFLTAKQIISDTEARVMLQNTILGMHMERDARFGNAGAIRELVDKLDGQRSVRIIEKQLDPLKEPLRVTDFPNDLNNLAETGKNARTQDCGFKAILDELDEMIGMGFIKEQMRSLVYRMELERRDGSKTVPTLHCLFVGKPGTGKTTVALKMARLFQTMGCLPSSRIKELDASEVIGQHVGDTDAMVKKIFKDALGGVLFLDEAYQYLKNPYGQEFLERLVAFMENNRQKVAVIAAGYPEEMKKFLDFNPGFPSRFANHIEFPNYTASEMADILESMIGDGTEKYRLAEGMRERIVALMEIKRSEPEFSNGRTARNILEIMKNRLSVRYGDSIGNVSSFVFMPEDLPPNYHELIDRALAAQVDAQSGYQTILDEIGGMIGMTDIKEQMQDFASRMNMAKSLNTGKPALHCIFTGNAGTGKTTVAHKMARMYQALGCLESARVTSIKSSEIIGQHVGVTRANAKKKFDEALGGVLFVDEAYNYPGDPYGEEFLQELLTFMEDNRESVAVIAAGYPKRMEAFLSSNEGFSSRFKRTVHFPDYTPEEMADIVELMMHNESDRFAFGSCMKDAIVRHMKLRAEMHDFSNGREARNFLDDMLTLLSKRIPPEKFKETGTIFLLPEDVPPFPVQDSDLVAQRKAITK